tara:strand:- start:379 stop:1098 length:720 start_codon:yes stop_codon:yes gene_type:complete
VEIEFFSIGDDPWQSEEFQEDMRKIFMKDGRLDTKGGVTNGPKLSNLDSIFRKAFLISSMAEVSKSPFFIETGTYLAETLMAVSPCFLYNWSVEGDETCYAWACSRTQWPVRKNVKILLGDSPDELPKILSEVDNHPHPNKKCIFFLDAHYSGAIDSQNPEWKTYSSKKYSHCPLLEEIDKIKKHQVKDHIIMIDDVRMLSKPGWPSIEQLLEALRGVNTKYQFKYCVELDILIAGVFK